MWLEQPYIALSEAPMWHSSFILFCLRKIIFTFQLNTMHTQTTDRRKHLQNIQFSCRTRFFSLFSHATQHNILSHTDRDTHLSLIIFFFSFLFSALFFDCKIHQINPIFFGQFVTRTNLKLEHFIRRGTDHISPNYWGNHDYPRAL